MDLSLIGGTLGAGIIVLYVIPAVFNFVVATHSKNSVVEGIKAGIIPGLNILIAVYLFVVLVLGGDGKKKE